MIGRLVIWSTYRLACWHYCLLALQTVRLLRSRYCSAGLKEVGGREVCVYSISCKSSSNIDVTLKWLQAHAK